MTMILTRREKAEQMVRRVKSRSERRSKAQSTNLGCLEMVSASPMEMATLVLSSPEDGSPSSVTELVVLATSELSPSISGAGLPVTLFVAVVAEPPDTPR